MIKIFKIIVVVTLLISSFFSIANEECSSCHSKEVSDWQQSHHANAMAKATPAMFPFPTVPDTAVASA